ncbi:T9SS type A sorting domain-containing protein [Halosquirtibacter xylanolyticus]|uniref:C25 family cysteine peptidase n=1 Tax=Halosquirtibacter xylanolyticus TaxID=3374599 RepID=UPI0037491658|nr:T9SS type A sorting domain-containing protein [Prolixibacteraceae bacterium]
MKKLYCLTIFMMVLSLMVNGQNRYLPFAKQLKSTDAVEQTILPEREVKELSDGTIEVTYYFKGAEVVDKEVLEDPYTFLHIKGFGQLGQVGAPALPMRNDHFALSKMDQASVELVDAKFMEYPNFMVHPALEPARDTQGAPEPEFEKDAAVYQKNAFFPSTNVSISMNQIMREVRIASVKICPVQFNPVTRTLRVYSKLVYRFHKGSKKTYTSLDQRAVDVLKADLINPDQLEHSASGGLKEVSADAKDYIIITHSSFDQAAKKLAAWKSSLGYKVDLVSQDTWTSAQVRTEIADRYREWNPKPKYYVIIGDVQFVPSMNFKALRGEDFVSDLYYSCMDGADDFTPDMARGRLSVASAAQANIVVDKIIKYEKDPVKDASFYQNGVNCAQFQDDERDGYATRRFCHTSEDIRNHVIDQGYDVQRIYYTDANVTPTHFNNGYFSNGEAIPQELLRANGFKWDGDVDDIVSSINSGKFYVFHRDHGYAGGYGWAHPEFLTSQMGRLHNGDKLPVVFSINCHTGEFSLKECFAEKFLRLKDAGAVAVFGASYYSLSGPNDGLSIGMVESIWPNPGILPSFGRGSAANNPPAQGFNNATTTLGDVLNLGLLRMNQTWAPSQNYLLYTYRLFHLFGDPSMRMWTQKPSILKATLPTDVSIGTSSININGVNKEDALVTLTVDGKLISKQRVSGGNATLRFSSIIEGRKAVVTVSKINCRPVYKSYTLQQTAPTTNFKMLETSPIMGNSAIIHFIADCEGEVTSYLWNFGSTTIQFMDDTDETSANPVVKYLEKGSYDVSLKATNDYGSNTHTISDAVQLVEGMPAASCTNTTKYLSREYEFGIYKVQIGSKYVLSESSYTEKGYKDHTDKGVFKITSKKVNIEVTVGTKYSENIAIFIDRDNNGIFSEAERVAIVGEVKGKQTLSFNVDNHFLGNQKLRMRVISDYYKNAITTACQDLSYGQSEDFIIEVSSNLPVVETIANPEVYDDNVVVGMRITASGGSSIIEQGVVVSESSAPTVDDTKFDAPKPYKMAARVILEGLESNTKYYARAYAINGSGINYGAEVTFTTKRQIKAAPKHHASKFIELEHGQTSATLSWGNSSYEIPDGYVIKWGTNSYSIASPINGQEDVTDTKLVTNDQMETTITGLTPNTNYYFKIYPFNNRGRDIRYYIGGSVPTTLVKTDDALTYGSLSGQGLSAIYKTVFNTIDNTSSRTVGYNDFLHLFTTVKANMTYKLEVGVNNIYVDEFWTYVWIDWDHDGSFETSERYTLGTVSGEKKIISKYIQVPYNATAGSCRMRIVYAWNNNTVKATGSLSYFNAEDYTININANDSYGINFRDNIQDNMDKSVTIEGIRIYPNPARTEVHIVLENAPEKRISADIIDMSGKTIHQVYLDRQDNLITLDLPSGIYFFKINMYGKETLHKLMIK